MGSLATNKLMLFSGLVAGYWVRHIPTDYKIHFDEKGDLVGENGVKAVTHLSDVHNWEILDHEETD